MLPKTTQSEGTGVPLGSLRETGDFTPPGDISNGTRVRSFLLWVLHMLEGYYTPFWPTRESHKGMCTLQGAATHAWHLSQERSKLQSQKGKNNRIRRRRRKSRLIYIMNLSPVSIGDTKFRQPVGVFVGEKSHLFIAGKG